MLPELEKRFAHPKISAGQRGVIHLLGLFFILLLAGGIVAGVYLTGNQQLFFGRADSGQVPSADACNSQLKWENNISQSKFKNADFQGGYSGGFPNNWNKFAISGDPQFGEETGYVPFGKSFRVSGDGKFSGGIYQTVDGLQAGKWYHAFYATAQKVSGEGQGALPTLREIGVDTEGGVDASKVVSWGLRSSGGQVDKDAKKYGGWKTMGSSNNPVVTFKATGTKATVFIKVSEQSDNAGRSDTWIVSAFLGEDCGSGQTIAAQTGGPSSAGSGITNEFSTNSAPATCDASKVKMSIEPNGGKVGDTVTLNLTNTGGEGTTKIADELTGLGSCTENFGLGANFDQPNFWPKVAKYLTCKVTAVPYKWAHKWTNCTPNDQACASGNACTKAFDSTSGEQKVIAPLTSGATGGTTPTNTSATDIKNKFGLTMVGFDAQRLGWAYAALSLAANTKFVDLVKGATIASAQGNLTYVDCSRTIELQQAPDEAVFKHALLHELSHRLFNCQTDPISKRTKHDQVYRSEGGISSYAVCGGNPGGQLPNYLQEDYAEMLSYYLDLSTKEIGSIPACNVNNGANPFADGKHPQHAALAKEILTK